MRLAMILFVMLFAKPALLIMISKTKSTHPTTKVVSLSAQSYQQRQLVLEKHIARLFQRHETLTEIHLTVGRAGVYPIAGIDVELDQLKELYRQAVNCLEEMENLKHEKWSELEKKFLSLDQIIAQAQKQLVQNIGQNQLLVSLYRI